MFVCSSPILSLCWLPRLDFTCMHTPSLPLAGQIAFFCFWSTYVDADGNKTNATIRPKQRRTNYAFSQHWSRAHFELENGWIHSQVAFHRIFSLLAGTQWRAPFNPLKYWVTITAVKNIMQQYLDLLWDVIKKLAGAQWHAQFKPPKVGISLCVQMHSSPLCCEIMYLVSISRLRSLVGFRNKLASLMPESCVSSKLWPIEWLTHWVTEVRCRATSVAKNE